MKAVILFLVALIAMNADAAKFCNEVAVNYTISTYEGNCIYGVTHTYEYNVRADHEVLWYNSTTGLFQYADIFQISVGDTVQSPFGTTTVTGISSTTITTPYIILGQIFTEDTVFSNGFNPYAVNEYLRWIATEPTEIAFKLRPWATTSYVNTTLTIDYHVPELDTDQLQTLLGLFNSSNMQAFGSISCNGTVKDIYYYDPRLLTTPLAMDTLYRSYKLMSFDEYFNMVAYALAQPDGMYFDGIEMIHAYSVTLPSCTAVDITTTDGYIVVNNLVLQA